MAGNSRSEWRFRLLGKWPISMIHFPANHVWFRSYKPVVSGILMRLTVSLMVSLMVGYGWMISTSCDEPVAMIFQVRSWRFNGDEWWFMGYNGIKWDYDWLVVTGTWLDDFSFSWEWNNHHNWRSHIFQMGGSTTNQLLFDQLTQSFLCWNSWFQSKELANVTIKNAETNLVARATLW